mgnify:CR=1 FL=1
MSWFFYEIAAVKPVIINVLCYTILFMVFSRLIFWRQDYVYNVSFLFMYASVISMLMASFFVLSDVAKGCIDVLLTYLTALVPAYATVLLASGKGFSASGFYMLAFVLIYVVEWLIKLVLIPGIHLFLVLEVLNHVSSERSLKSLPSLLNQQLQNNEGIHKDSGRHRHSPGHDCSRKGQNIGKPYLKKFSGDTGCGEAWAGCR